MSYIKTISPQDTREMSSELVVAYQELGKMASQARILQLQSLHPEAMLNHYKFYESLMQKASPLSRKFREMIAFAVSKINGCEYLMKHHGEALEKEWEEKSLVQSFLQDPLNSESLSPKERAGLVFAQKLSTQITKMSAQDCNNLRELDYSDREILDLAQIASYFNFVNRMAEGLGLIEDSEPH